jgi:hypothetical protein
MISLRHLCLVCFKENEFLEFIFLTFPCLATLGKSSQWKLNSSQQKNTVLSKESVFLRIKKGKHFPFHKSRSLSLVKNDFSQITGAGTITEAFSGQLKHFACTISGMFFSSISFMFYNPLCRSVKSMAFHFHNISNTAKGEWN